MTDTDDTRPEDARCGEPHPENGRACILMAGHPEEVRHTEGTVHWRTATPEPESDAPSWPPAEWKVPDLTPWVACGLVTGCEKRDGHDGPHIVSATVNPQAPVSGPCGLRFDRDNADSVCALESGHEGLHGTSVGDPLAGRLVEDVLTEVMRRLAMQESGLDRQAESVQRFRRRTHETYERQARLFAEFQGHVTDRLQGLKREDRTDTLTGMLAGSRLRSVPEPPENAVVDRLERILLLLDTLVGRTRT